MEVNRLCEPARYLGAQVGGQHLGKLGDGGLDGSEFSKDGGPFRAKFVAHGWAHWMRGMSKKRWLPVPNSTLRARFPRGRYVRSDDAEDAEADRRTHCSTVAMLMYILSLIHI